MEKIFFYHLGFSFLIGIFSHICFLYLWLKSFNLGYDDSFGIQKLHSNKALRIGLIPIIIGIIISERLIYSFDTWYIIKILVNTWII